MMSLRYVAAAETRRQLRAQAAWLLGRTPSIFYSCMTAMELSSGRLEPLHSSSSCDVDGGLVRDILVNLKVTARSEQHISGTAGYGRTAAA